MGVLSHSGSLVILRFRPSGPTTAVFSSSASSLDKGFSCVPPTKSENDGPALSLSLKEVLGWAGFVTPPVAEGGSGVVAKLRVMDDGTGRMLEALPARIEAPRHE
jgi:hypothetical protein